MYSIYGKHSIIAAAKNIKRSGQIFYGFKDIYHEYGLECEYKYGNQEPYLLVNELFVKSHFFRNRIIFLDGIMDVGNIGAIIRSAAVCEYDVLLRREHGCAINETVVRCASGGIEYINIDYINISDLKTRFSDYFIYALTEKGTISIQHAPKNEKIILIVGSEDSGISLALLKITDLLCYIPGNSKFMTLNASVAAGLAMFNLI